MLFSSGLLFLFQSIMGVYSSLLRAPHSYFRFLLFPFLPYHAEKFHYESWASRKRNRHENLLQWMTKFLKLKAKILSQKLFKVSKIVTFFKWSHSSWTHTCLEEIIRRNRSFGISSLPSQFRWSQFEIGSMGNCIG